MADLQKPLITASRGNHAKRQFQTEFKECELRYNRIKQKNDLVQKTSDSDIDRDILRQIKSQGQFIQTETVELTKKLTALKKQYRDPGYKIRLEKLQKNLSDQISRNKIIMTNYINRVSSSSFMRHRGTASGLLEEQSERDSGNIFIHINASNQPNNLGQKRRSRQEPGQNMAMMSEIEREIERQRSSALKELQQRMYRVNHLVNDIAFEVYEQGQNVDILDQNMNQALARVQDANEELNQGQKQQKKAKNKYFWLVLIVLIVAVAAAGVALLLL